MVLCWRVIIEMAEGWLARRTPVKSRIMNSSRGMHPLDGERHGRALLDELLAFERLYAERVIATVDVHQLQAWDIAGLAIGIAVEHQSQQMLAL